MVRNRNYLTYGAFAIEKEETARKNKKDLTTVESKIGNLLLLVVINSGFNKDIIPKFIADELELEINTSVIYGISGISEKSKLLGRKILIIVTKLRFYENILL